MSFSGRRFNQVFMVVMSGLLVAGSGILIVSGPPSNQMPDGRIPSDGTVSVPDSDAADALVPANSAELARSNSDERRSVIGIGRSAPTRATRTSASASLRKSTDVLAGTVVIRQVPVSDSDIESAWRQAAPDSCEFIPPNEPFEITRPIPFLTNGDRRQAERRRPTPAIRQHVLSVGLQMPRQVEQSLPTLGRRSITDYLQRHYVSVQARVQHDPASGLVYLHHRPLAATMQYTGSRLTREFTETVGKSMHDFRGLGIWLLPDEELKPENLRTLVLVQRYVISETGASRTKPKTVCELMFIRGRAKNEGTARSNRVRTHYSRLSTEDGATDLELHTFVTTEGRQFLHYITSDTNPQSSQQCGIKALIEFTAFSHGAYPTESIVVGTQVRGSATYNSENLERFAQQKGWTGGCFEHLSELLDAIIAKELTAD